MRQQKALDRKGGQCETTTRHQIARVENARPDIVALCHKGGPREVWQRGTKYAHKSFFKVQQQSLPQFSLTYAMVNFEKVSAAYFGVH